MAIGTACPFHRRRFAFRLDALINLMQNDPSKPEEAIMAMRRGRFSLTPPRRVTFALSLVLVAVALASLHIRLPVGQSFVALHRFWLVVAGYAVLALGVLLPGV